MIISEQNKPIYIFEKGRKKFLESVYVHSMAEHTSDRSPNNFNTFVSYQEYWITMYNWYVHNLSTSLHSSCIFVRRISRSKINIQSWYEFWPSLLPGPSHCFQYKKAVSSHEWVMSKTERVYWTLNPDAKQFSILQATDSNVGGGQLGVPIPHATPPQCTSN